MINDQQCNHIARKHGIEPSDQLRAAIKESFRLGKNSEVMKATFKEEKKQ